MLSRGNPSAVASRDVKLLNKSMEDKRNNGSGSKKDLGWAIKCTARYLTKQSFSLKVFVARQNVSIIYSNLESVLRFEKAL